MAITVRDAKLDSRNARSKLPIQHKPFWRVIDQGCHLGYRKGIRGGVWRARYLVTQGKYAETVLGKADDVQDADGLEILSFSQAQEAARSWFSLQVRKQAGLPVTESKGFTVSDVLDLYLAWFLQHRKSYVTLKNAVEAHVRPALGNIEISALTPQKVRTFHEQIAQAPPRRRGWDKQKTQQTTTPMSLEQKRQRRSTANRVLTTLKAALNHAYTEGRISSDEAWRRVKPFRNVDSARVRYLNESECKALVSHCTGAFADLVQAAILTGCRYGELIKLKANDVNFDSGTVLITDSKSGQSRHVVLTEEGQVFFKRALNGIAVEQLIFQRDDGNEWGKSHQSRPLAEACDKAEIRPQISFHTLRHTHASHLAMRGAPLPVIAAQLGHSDTRMVEKHYAHLAPNYIAETIRKGFPHIGFE
ncbi:Integrase family protein [Magnetospirillum gryphiswaldense MSR-1 v2]|uniref:Integrase family protein n=1 Tax=Magnetospirillum gryphiswaldense (strain DSM 6361 / JCM 21280 / NBRC 15271 / MSR-1) TaxID=431944 RepID=V6EXD8_MAGGM|nr:site-specific integrase [Magnetospirillum gryphiswaldense]CDK97854.1 Integrase family protein [Magnetospirillum gryphiswaldense MSR-1 v2]